MKHIEYAPAKSRRICRALMVLIAGSVGNRGVGRGGYRPQGDGLRHLVNYSHGVGARIPRSLRRYITRGR